MSGTPTWLVARSKEGAGDDADWFSTQDFSGARAGGSILLSSVGAQRSVGAPIPVYLAFFDASGELVTGGSATLDVHPLDVVNRRVLASAVSVPGLAGLTAEYLGLPPGQYAARLTSITAPPGSTEIRVYQQNDLAR